MNRQSWPEYFMNVACLISSRSTCRRRHVGAVAVRDRQILATGYNGAPAGLPHCETTGCLRQQLNIPSGQRHEICRGLHAEQNAIIQAGLHGTNLSGADLFCTDQPCILCAKMLINCGIKRIYFINPYPDPMAAQMLEQAGIELIQLDFTPPVPGQVRTESAGNN